MNKIINNSFSKFLLSNIINKFGDSIDLIAFMWLTYEVTDSTFLTGVVVAFNGVPSIILGLFSGVIADRFDRKKLIVCGDFFRGVIVLVICSLYIFKLLNVYCLLLATLMISTFEIISTPARRAMLPVIIKKDELLKANSFLASGKLIAQLLGLSFSGIIISKLGVITAVGIDGITFFISAILIKMIKIKTNDKENKKKKVRIIVEVREVFVILVKEITVFKTTILATVINIFIGCYNLLILNYCKDVLQNESNGQSILNAVNVLGVLLVSLVLIKYVKNISYEKIIDIGFILMAISFVLYSISSKMYFSIPITLLFGVGTGFITITSVTLIQKNTPIEHLGKMLAIISLVNESSIPLGNLLAGWLMQNYSISLIFLLYGLIMLISALVIFIIFSFIKSRKTLKSI